MTKDEILNMPAGREMDALIAEHVMGWKKIVIGGVSWYLREGPLGMSYQYMTQAGDFAPSEDIAAAFQVVAKMREKGFDFYAEWVTEKAVNRQNSMPWACFSPDDGESVYSASGATMPLAIGYAALLAMDGKQ